MFDTLADRIKKDERQDGKERVIRYLLYLAVSGVLFGGLYFVVRHLQ